MKPTIGRIVHYQTADGDTLPAMIVRVHSDTCVNLKVFQDSTESSRHETSVIKGTSPRTWAWPVVTSEVPPAISQADGAGVCVK
jgi:hypothetical protein